MNWRKTFQIIGLIAALLSLLPLIAADYWWIRLFDFPHLLLTGFTLLAIILYFFTFKPKWINDYAYIIVLLGCFAFQMSKVMDYTPIVGVEVEQSTANLPAEDKILVYTANVLQENKEGDALFEQIRELQPDLILLTETNTRWKNKIESQIGDLYPHKVAQIQDNTYGMMLYSKLRLIDPEVKFQADPKIPSIHSKVELRNGELFQLYAIHPTPPMPQHNPMSTDRDQELMKTAILSNNSELPVIVMGDFNDVSWSSPTQLTKRIGRLLDLRIGRKFNNSYHAQYFPLRWPLDHILTTREWRCQDAGTGVDFGSDHFPIYAYLTYEPELSDQQDPELPSKSDWEDARDQLGKNGIESFTKLPDELDKLIKE